MIPLYDKKCPVCGKPMRHDLKDMCAGCAIAKAYADFFRIKCPVCGKHTLEEFEVCPECLWENDHWEGEGGANIISLEEAKRQYKKFGRFGTDLVGK